MTDPKPAEIVRDITRLEVRSREALNSFWELPLIWGVAALGSLVFVVARGYPGDGPFSGLWFTYMQLNGYWGWVLPLGIVGSFVVYRRRLVKPVSRFSIRYLPVWVALALFLLIGSIANEPDGHCILGCAMDVPPNGPAGWLPLVAATTLLGGWVTRTRLVTIVSALLFGFAMWWQWSGAHELLALQAAFAVAYLSTAVALYERGRRVR